MPEASSWFPVRKGSDQKGGAYNTSYYTKWNMKELKSDIAVQVQEMRKSPAFDGYSFGLLIMRSWVPKPLGHVSQINTYDYPILPYIVEGSNFSRILGGDMTLVPNIIEAAKDLENCGCKCITSSCGYFGRYQKHVAEALNVPVYISSLCQIPWVLSGLNEEKKIIVLCYDDALLKKETLLACGLSEKDISRCMIKGLCNEPEFANIRKCQGYYNIEIAREEIVNMALRLQRENEDVVAIVLECTDMPPHAAAIQKATNLPVFDVTTLLDFINSVVM